MTKLFNKFMSAFLMTAMFIGLISPVSLAAVTVPGWEMVNSGGQDFQYEFDTTNKYAGNASLKMSYKTSGGDNVYAALRQYVTVEPNTTYTYSMWVKADKIGGVQSLISWGTRYDLQSLGTTFDWKKFEFSWYSGESTRAEFMLILGSSSKALWVDEMTFCKAGTDVNLFQNPGFESGVEITEPENNPDTGDTGNNISGNQNYLGSIQDFGDAFLEGRYMPIPKAHNIIIDGDLSDWSDATHIHGEGSGISADFYSLYDEEYFYLAVETPDETHSASVQGTGIWMYDSIQFVIGTSDEMYGREVSASFDADGPLYFYSEQWHESDQQKIKSYGRHADNISYYELAIPWELMGTSYDANNLVLDVLVNDNDNDANGRQYYEFTSGIGTTKVNEDFLNIYCLKDNELTASITAPIDVYTDIETECVLFVVNNSDTEKIVGITTAGGTTEENIPPKGVYKETFVQTFSENGENIIKGEIVSGGEVISLEKSINVERTSERLLSDADKLKNEELPKLKALLDECEAANIPVDYELSDYTIIDFYIDRVTEDVANNLDFRAEYILNELIDIYNEAISNLNAYLSGEKEAKTTYKYQTSQLETDGQTIWADMKNSQNGEIERRPVFQMGYNAFGDGTPVNYFPDMGFNTLAIEVGINQLIVQPGGTHGWTALNRKDNTTAEIVYEDESEDNSVLKIVSDSDPAAEKYLQFYQDYQLKPNTTYEYGFKVKGENINQLWFSIAGWSTERMYAPEGSYDWKEFNFEYTTGATADNQPFGAQFFIFCDGRIDEALVDDVYVREKGSSTNLLSNGDFETARGMEIYKDMIFMSENFDGYEEILNNAAEKNVSICLQIATHYWPYFTTSDDPSTSIPGHFTGDINYSHERVREVTEYFLKNLLERIKDKPALHSLILGNEPGYCTLGNEEFYQPIFQQYLMDIYDNDITKLNETYHSNYTSFEEVTFSEVKQGDTQNWLTFGIDLSKYEPTPIFYDWVNFNYSVYTDWATFLYNTIKKYAPNVKVHIKQLAGTWRYDHDYFRQWLRNGVNAEQLAEVTDLNGCDAQGILNNEEQSISTKMRWYDYLTSIDNAPIFNSEDHSIPDNSDNYDPRVAIWTGATTWQGAVHGCTSNTTWVWANSYDKNTGLYGSVMVRPDAAHNQAEATLDLNRLAFEVKSLTDAKADVAVMDSLPSHALDRIFENVSYNAWQSSTYSGQRTDFITEKQCAEGKLNQYKIVLVPKCDRVEESTLNALREYIANGGRVILFGEDCLKYDEYGNPYDESLYSDIVANSRVVPITWSGLSMTSPTNEEIRDMLWQEFDNLGMNKVRLVDTATGETVYNVEWEYANYEDSIIINVNNYDWASTPTIAVEVNGQRVSEFVELRSMETKQGTIQVNPYEPVLLKVQGNV